MELADAPSVPVSGPRRHPAGRAAEGAADRATVPVQVDIVVRPGASTGSAEEMPVVLRDLLRAWAAQQRVQPLRPHR
ncbi:hypothetical protein ACFC06_09030 [Nocardia sp. NPDC056064]|uniref:hypothetical protein n=1 Tax=Nocardia sp. NPDC056064 TaxID=3345701 RepID=UPI0035D84FFF